MITILIGKSASGKDRFLNELQNKYNFTPIISTTSRPMRIGEINGKDYNFISHKDFEQKIKENCFLEYRSYNTLVNNKPDAWYYGTEKAVLDLHKEYVVVLDIQGTEAFINNYGRENCFVVYINAKDEIREKRASKRGSFDKIEWDRRIADDNIKFSKKNIEDVINYQVVNNDIDSIEFIASNIVNAGIKYETITKIPDKHYIILEEHYRE